MNRKKQGKIAAVIIMLKDDEKAGHLVALELCRVHGKAVNYNEAEKYASQEYKIRPGNIDVNHALAWISFKKK